MGNSPSMNVALKPIHAVTFDVGGTLIEPWPSVGHIYAQVAARFGISGVEPDALNRGFVRAWKGRRDFDYSRGAWRGLVEQTFTGLVPEPPTEACFDGIYNHFAHAEAWRVFDDTWRALGAVKASGRKIGLISNWDERLRPLLNELQLAAHFEAITISCEVGCTKPKPGIFRQCAAQLGLPSESILHVGDSASEDVAGAKAAGMRAVLLDRMARDGSNGSIPSLSRVADGLERGQLSGDTD